MLFFEAIRDPLTGEEWIETSLSGKQLLLTPLLNKGTSFTESERDELGLLGKLPAKIETLQEQVQRAYRQYKKYKSDLQRHVYLNNLHDKNEVLFYKLVSEHLVEMIPIVYTPTVGQAVKEFSHEYRQPRGLYINFSEQDKMEEILVNRTHPNISIIVVTDGERVLGIGDQGVGSIGIPIAKLMIYTMCAGINPYHTLPILLDVGTDNEELLKDPFYLGWRHPRIRGEKYDQFIEKFVRSVMKLMPGAFLHWEDFGRNNARRILEKYQQTLCTFNDDMQGTSVVATAAILSALNRSSSILADQKIVILGAGTAGVGIADRLVDFLKRSGISESEARNKIWLVDKEGLVTQNTPNMPDFQLPFAKEITTNGPLDLEAVVTLVKPSILIGCAAAKGAFTEKIVRLMASYTPHPIILPLSNPNAQSEADPLNILEWTENRALVATGSPFHPSIAQCNNVFSFPGIGLGIMASKAAHLTDDLLMVACRTLSRLAPSAPGTPLLPSLKDARQVAITMAISIVKEAKKLGLANIPATLSAEDAVAGVLWEPYYRNIRVSTSSRLMK